MTGPIAIAISGGIDSLVAAALLKEQGHAVFAVHFLSGYENSKALASSSAKALGRALDLPVFVIDLAEPFKKKVVDYFTSAYQQGETPNPCLVCNPSIKFGVLLKEARQRGASHLATGHYARVERDSSGLYRLRKGMDAAKDQSYFLAHLTQKQLARACFPLGTWTKEQVRAYARDNGLMPVTRSESQDVCFIRDTSYADFIEQVGGTVSRPGEIVDAAGRRVGSHNGLHRYTVGQRRGINIPASRAYYVIRLDTRHNRLVVGFKEDTYSSGCRVRDVNWITGEPEEPLKADTRIRYRHKAAASIVAADEQRGANVHFDQPQASVTPGQGAVFYRGDEVVGGGWIENS